MIGEADWEQITLERLGELGWRPQHGASIAPGTGERRTWADL